jgi:hypothetical protein
MPIKVSPLGVLEMEGKMDDFGEIRPFKAEFCTNNYTPALPMRFLCVGCSVDMTNYSERKLVHEELDRIREEVNRMHKLFSGRFRDGESEDDESEDDESEDDE